MVLDLLPNDGRFASWVISVAEASPANVSALPTLRRGHQVLSLAQKRSEVVGHLLLVRTSQLRLHAWVPIVSLAVLPSELADCFAFQESQAHVDLKRLLLVVVVRPLHIGVLVAPALVEPGRIDL